MARFERARKLLEMAIEICNQAINKEIIVSGLLPEAHLKKDIRKMKAELAELERLEKGEGCQ